MGYREMPIQESGRPGPEGAAWPEAGAAGPDGQTPAIRHQEPGKLAGTHT